MNIVEQLRRYGRGGDSDAEGSMLQAASILEHQRDEIVALKKSIETLTTERTIVLQEHELMRSTLQTIAGGASDGLQRTQAAGALSNIGPR
jgi:hypothetical protein